jgi:hypothetical protein
MAAGQPWRSMELTTKFTKQLTWIVYDKVYGTVEFPPCIVNFAVNRIETNYTENFAENYFECTVR